MRFEEEEDSLNLIQLLIWIWSIATFAIYSNVNKPPTFKGVGQNSVLKRGFEAFYQITYEFEDDDG